jgi:fumarate reductase subunit C
MATDALHPRVNAAAHGLRPVNRTVERGFYAGLAILMCAIVVYGFSHTYFLAGMMRAPLPNRLLHVHGAVFTLWMVLFLLQSALVTAGRVAWHRTLGTVAFCLPPIMIVLGIIAALNALHRGVMIGPLSPETSLAIPLIGIVGFTIVIAASWAARRRPDAHKRLIMYATAGLCEAAFGRFPWDKIGLPPAAGAVIGLGSLMVLMLVWDLISLHRIHRSSMWAAPLTFAFGAFAVPIGMTPAWHSFAAFLARTIAPLV